VLRATLSPALLFFGRKADNRFTVPAVVYIQQLAEDLGKAYAAWTKRKDGRFVPFGPVCSLMLVRDHSALATIIVSRRVVT